MCASVEIAGYVALLISACFFDHFSITGWHYSKPSASVIRGDFKVFSTENNMAVLYSPLSVLLLLGVLN